MIEHLPKAMTHILTVMALALVIQRMVRKKAAPVRGGEALELRYHPWVGWLGVGVLAMSLTAIGFEYFKREQGWAGTMVCFACIGLLGLVGVLYGISTRYVLDPEKIVSHVFWRPPRTLYWLEVQEVEFTSTSQFKIKPYRGDSIQVDMLIGGLDSLLEAFSRYLPADKYVRANIGYWNLAQKYRDSMGDVLVVPPSDYHAVAGKFERASLDKFLEKIAPHLEQGFGPKEMEKIQAVLRKLKVGESMKCQFKPLFQGVPIQLIFWISWRETGRELCLIAPPKLAARLKDEMEKSGAKDVHLNDGSDEEDQDEELDEVEETASGPVNKIRTGGPKA